MLVGKRDAVASRDLTGEPERLDGPRIRTPHVDVRILGPRPFRRVAGVEVREGSLDRGDGGVLAQIDEEPQLVALDGAATRTAGVPRTNHAGWLQESIADQRV